MNALDLIKQCEGCRLKAYADPGTNGAPFTIGWGETQGVTPDMVWTQQKADETLERRVEEFTKKVLAICPQLSYEPPYRLAACVSLAYNIGLRAFATSSVKTFTEQKNYYRAAGSFSLWNKSGNKIMAGLINRRRLEKSVYLGQS